MIFYNRIQSFIGSADLIFSFEETLRETQLFFIAPQRFFGLRYGIVNRLAADSRHVCDLGQRIIVFKVQLRNTLLMRRKKLRVKIVEQADFEHFIDHRHTFFISSL